MNAGSENDNQFLSQYHFLHIGEEVAAAISRSKKIAHYWLMITETRQRNFIYWCNHFKVQPKLDILTA